MNCSSPTPEGHIEDNTQDGSEVSTKSIKRNRTYTRKQLMERIPGCSKEFMSHLIQFFGLIPLGISSHFYDGQNVLDSLRRYSVGDVVNESRKPLSRAQLREMVKGHQG